MTIINMGTHVLIAHKLGGAGELAENLGQMSLELANWLSAMHMKQTAQQRNNIIDEDLAAQSDQNRTLPNDLETELFTFSRLSQENHEIIERSKNAAQRGYKPALYEFGRLTHIGEIKAQQAQEVIRDINEQQQDLTFMPHLWTDLDDYFIRADIPIRSLKMLKLIHAALTKAESDVAAYNMAVMAGRIDPTEPGKTAEARQKAWNEQFVPAKKLASLETFASEDTKPETDFDVVFLDVADDKKQPFAHTSTLRQKGRTDLQYLIKFGLVNLAGYRDGARGRPKHVVWPSKVGLKALSELGRRGFI